MDGFQKEGGNFLNLFQKEVGPQKRGVPSEKGGGGPNPGGNCGITLNLHYYGTKTRAGFSKHLHL